jgi:hypothetical protein
MGPVTRRMDAMNHHNFFGKCQGGGIRVQSQRRFPFESIERKLEAPRGELWKFRNSRRIARQSSAAMGEF